MDVLFRDAVAILGPNRMEVKGNIIFDPYQRENFPEISAYRCKERAFWGAISQKFLPFGKGQALFLSPIAGILRLNFL